MQIKFWGTRGSIPTPLSSEEIQQKMRQALLGAAGLDLADPTVVDHYLDRLPLHIRGTIGGNTTCVEVWADDQLIIIDAGSGLRLLGTDLLRRGLLAGGTQADFLITHTHWDHIHGFPFFGPAFIPGNQLTFHSPFNDLDARLNQQQHEVFFPIDMDYMQADFQFKYLKPQQWTHINNIRVYPMPLSHPGETYGYRIEYNGRSLVFASDSEYKRLDRKSTEQIVSFFKEADLLIFDAQYSLTEVLDKPDWGHSSAIMGAELAHRAKVKHVMLFHHDPTSSDEKIIQAQEEAEAYLQRAYANNGQCQISTAYDGLEIAL